jgi:hypothetical protein
VRSGETGQTVNGGALKAKRVSHVATLADALSELSAPKLGTALSGHQTAGTADLTGAGTFAAPAPDRGTVTIAYHQVSATDVRPVDEDANARCPANDRATHDGSPCRSTCDAGNTHRR